MSRLIEKPASTHGFLKRQGKDFAFERGTKLIETGGPALLLEPVQATPAFKGAALGLARGVDI